MKDEEFVPLKGWVLRLPLTINEKVVLSYIGRECDWNGGVCRKSQAEFCEDLGIDRSSLKRALAKIEGCGYISRITGGHGAGVRSEIRMATQSVEGGQNAPQIRGSKCTPKKGAKRTPKRGSKCTPIPFKEISSLTNVSLLKERVRESARTHEPSLSEADAVAIVRRYEGRQHDPNGREYNPTEAETAEYNEALAAVSRYKAERAEAEFAEVMARYPDLLQWKQQPTADHYARLVAEYGKSDVEEAMAYAANRIDLKWQYMNPLGYVEQNIKGRKAGIRGSKPAARR